MTEMRGRETGQADYRTLGRTGLKVSGACLGAMNFGSDGDAPCGEDEARRVIDAFLDRGYNFLDTANVYRGGQSEEVVGRAIRNKRDAVVLATKAYHPQGPGPNDRGLSRVHLAKALEASLRRLNTDYVDLYQCHLWDADTPIDETLAVLDGFVNAGKVRYYGCSNFTAVQIVESQWASQRLGAGGFVSLQSQYSLLARDIEFEIVSASSRHGLGLLAYGVLGSGVLTGKYRPGEPPPPGTRLNRMVATVEALERAWANAPAVSRVVATFTSDRSFRIANEVSEIAAELGTTPTAVATAWTRARPWITSVILGPRTLHQLETNLEGFGIHIPDEAMARLDRVSEPRDVTVTGIDLSQAKPAPAG